MAGEERLLEAYVEFGTVGEDQVLSVIEGLEGRLEGLTAQEQLIKLAVELEDFEAVNAIISRATGQIRDLQSFMSDLTFDQNLRLFDPAAIDQMRQVRDFLATIRLDQSIQLFDPGALSQAREIKELTDSITFEQNMQLFDPSALQQAREIKSVLADIETAQSISLFKPEAISQMREVKGFLSDLRQQQAIDAFNPQNLKNAKDLESFLGDLRSQQNINLFNPQNLERAKGIAEFMQGLKLDQAIEAFDPAALQRGRQIVGFLEEIEDAQTIQARREMQLLTREMGRTVDMAARLDRGLSQATQDEFAASFRGVGRSVAGAENFLFNFVNLLDDAQYGFRGVANNIPITVASFNSLVGQAGSVSGAFTLMGQKISQFLSLIPGLGPAAGILGGLAVGGGVAASVGDLEDYIDVLGEAASVTGKFAKNALNVFAPVADFIRDNLVGGFVRFMDEANAALRDFTGVAIGVEGTSLVREARKEIEALAVADDALSGAAKDLDEEIQRLRRGMQDGSRDTEEIRIKTQRYQEVLNEFNTANAIAEINKLDETFNNFDFDVDFKSAIDQFRRLQEEIDAGGQRAIEGWESWDRLALRLQEFGIGAVKNDIRELRETTDLLTESEFDKTIDKWVDKIRTLRDLDLLTGGAYSQFGEFQQEAERALNAFRSGQNDLRAQENFFKARKKATEEIIRDVERLREEAKSTGEEFEDMVELLANGLRTPELNLDFNEALFLLDREISEIFQKSIDKIGELGDVRVQGNVQIGTQESQNALNQLFDAQDEQNRIAQETRRAEQQAAKARAKANGYLSSINASLKNSSRGRNVGQITRFIP